MARFVEATVLYRAPEADPRDPAGERSQKRLINLDVVHVVAPTADGKNRSVFHMRRGESPSLLMVTEPYDYWVAVLTYDQARPL